MADFEKTPPVPVTPGVPQAPPDAHEAGPRELPATMPVGKPKIPPSPPKGPPRPTEPKDSFREIVETIVFVVVLVLLLKSFVAEAFVIPTGSMATTLYGYQKDVKCPQCGYTFPVNCSDEVEGKDGRTTPILGGMCPNCRYPIDFAREHLTPGCSTGDRVLVAKYFYDSGLVKPERLDVVVFKFPQEPQVKYQAMNYIKRLIGLPGETIGIYYGKLYVLPPGQGPTHDDSSADPINLWREEFMHAGQANDLLLRENSPFQIIRKPPKKILALRRIVFDNDFQPRDLKGIAPPRWLGEQDNGRWVIDQPFGFRHVARTSDQHAPGTSDQLDWLRYRHILREGYEPELITDFIGYNTKATLTDANLSVIHPVLPRNWVGDLILECEVTVDQPEGDLVLELSKGVDRFQARWQLGTGDCTLVRLTGGREIKLETKPTSLKKKGVFRVRFANVDERLTVWVDGKLPFDDGVAYEAPKTRGPTANDLQPASIGVRGATVSVHKVQLWRDTYYTVTVHGNPSDSRAVRELLGDPRVEQELHKLLSNPDQWDGFRDLPCTTLYVQPGHYLCLGDNSPESSDGRSWGLVPERLLLGRALFVYWPLFSRAGPIR
jgi:signal peptidase I